MLSDVDTSDTKATRATCPKCGAAMDLVAIAPHPLAIHMERHRFLCVKRNQTQTYMLPRPPTSPVFD